MPNTSTICSQPFNFHLNEWPHDSNSPINQRESHQTYVNSMQPTNQLPSQGMATRLKLTHQSERIPPDIRQQYAVNQSTSISRNGQRTQTHPSIRENPTRHTSTVCSQPINFHLKEWPHDSNSPINQRESHQTYVNSNGCFKQKYRRTTLTKANS